MKEAKPGSWRLTLLLWTLLCGISMAVMLLFSANKTIAIADVAQDEMGSEAQQSVSATEDNSSAILFQKSEAGETRLCVPLEAGLKADQVVMENRYMDGELWIYIKSGNQEFYRENALFGNTEPVIDGTVELYQGEVLLKIQMTDVWEYRSILDGNYLYIEYLEPEEMYDKVIVIDPGRGGSDVGAAAEGCKEKDVTLQIAKLVKKKLDKTDIKVYYTRMEDIDLDSDKRAAIANAVGADLFISIGTDTGEGSAYGIRGIYNEDYFIPEFGNVETADTLVRNVTTAVNGRAVGIAPAEEGSVLEKVKVPAAQIQVGFLSHPKERKLLKQEAYLELIADGIVNGITEAYQVRDAERIGDEETVVSDAKE